LEFEVILKLVGAHDAGDGNAIFFKDEIFLVDVHALYDLAEIYAGFGYGETMYHATLRVINVNRHSSV
jgi:hypothetical protein